MGSKAVTVAIYGVVTYIGVTALYTFVDKRRPTADQLREEMHANESLGPMVASKDAMTKQLLKGGGPTSWEDLRKQTEMKRQFVTEEQYRRQVEFAKKKQQEENEESQKSEKS